MICVSSGGRILGLGDLGANGMGIPIGKLQLFTACAAVPPQGVLPVHFDIGTTNQALLTDPLYLGLRQPRVSDAEVGEAMDEFTAAVQEVFQGCCIHFEDWKGTDAMRLLARYRDGSAARSPLNPRTSPRRCGRRCRTTGSLCSLIPRSPSTTACAPLTPIAGWPA